MKRAVPLIVVEGNVQAERSGFYAGQGTNSFDQLIVKICDLLISVVTRFWQRNVSDQNIFRIESEWCVLRVTKTFQSQSSTGEQEQCEGNLRHNKSRSDALPLHAVTCSATTFVERKAERSC